MKIKFKLGILFAIVFCLTIQASVVLASGINNSSYVDLASDAYSAADYGTGDVSIEGGFSVSGGVAHYWKSTTGYSTLDLNTGVLTNIGKPMTQTNGYGDPFGAYDPLNNYFYAATYNNGGESCLYKYDCTSGVWSSQGAAVNLYGGVVSNGELYISGLREPWTGGYDSNYISKYDFSAANAHDALIETGGASAHLAVANNGDIYYACYTTTGTTGLFRWTAEQIASVTNDLAGGDEDTFLTLQDGEKLSDLPGGGNGITVDDAGNVFISTNSYPDSTLMRWNGVSGDGDNFETIATNPAGSFGWFGPLDIEGNFLTGSTLYGSYGWGGPITGITYEIPEPATLGFLIFGVFSLMAKHSRKTA